MSFFKLATFSTAFGRTARRHSESEAQPQSSAEKNIAVEMANKKGEYTMTWTTEPRDWKDSGAPQKGYSHEKGRPGHPLLRSRLEGHGQEGGQIPDRAVETGG